MTEGKILIADDDPQIRRVLQVTLRAQGYKVAEASSGEDAVEQARRDGVDLVLLDVNMPGMGGLRACNLIRSTSDVAIIMLTVRSGERDKVEALDAGADDYITKPFGVPELLARIRAALRRSPQPAEQRSIVTEGLEINMATRQVRVRNHLVRLTPKEFELLQYLATHPNIPIPHLRLLQAVWGPEYGSEVEYLRVFINQIRKKIEENPSKPTRILTEPWVGYRFWLP